jgi:nitrate reductase NapA
MAEQVEPTRRELLKVAAGLGAAGAVAAGTWGVLELLIPPGRAAEYHKGVCRYCGTGCGIQVGVTRGAVTDVRGDPEAHNKGVICVKGSTLPELMRAQGRLLTPKIRKAGKLADVSWDEALDLVSSSFLKFIEKDKDSVAFYGSGQLFCEESYTANKLFKAGIGTNNVDGNPRLCMASAVTGYVGVFGKDEPCGCYEDIDFAHCFFLIGANPFECHPPLMERIRRRKAIHPDTKIICVDPRRTRTAELSDYHLPVVPGTDLLLLNAMAQVITDPVYRLWDPKFISEHVRFDEDGKTVDLERFRVFLQDYTPEKVAERLGISATVIREVAFLFARSKATMSLWTMGMNQRVQGTYLNQMLSGLHLLTGQICRPGATPLSLTGQANACGGVRDTGSLSHALPGGRFVANPKHRAEMEKLWNVPAGRIAPKRGYHAVELFQAVEKGDVKGLLVMCTNPAQSLPSVERYRKAMATMHERGGLLVVAEVFEDSETAKLADVLLPAALWAEKEGVYGQTERRYQLIEKLLDPPGEAKSDLWILVELAKRLGKYGEVITSQTSEAVWDEWRQMSAHSKYNFAGMTRERLKHEHGLQWPCPDEKHPGTKRRFVGGDDPFVSAGKTVEFYGQEFPGDPTKHHRAVVFLRPYKESPEIPTKEYPLLLTTGRVLEQWHTGTMTDRLPELAKASGPGHFELNDQDALRLGIKDGDTIRVKSRFGDLSGRATVTDRPRQGVLFACFYDAKFLVNQVVADHFDAFSFEPEFKVTAVSVAKAEEGGA